MFRGIGYIILGSGSVNEFPDAFTDFGIDTIGEAPISLDDRAVPRARADLRARAAEERRSAGASTPSAEIQTRRSIRASECGRIRFWPYSSTRGVVSAHCRHRVHGAARECAGQQRGRHRTRRDHHRAARRRQRLRRQGPAHRRALGACADRDPAQRPRHQPDRRRRARHGHRPAADRLAAASARLAALLRVGERLSGFAQLWRLQPGRSAGGQIQPDFGA